jgi:hypothetical protein
MVQFVEMNVAIIVIATGAYTKFFKNLYASIKQNFLPGHTKTVLLLTDVKTGWPADVIVHQALHLPWPLPSLLRFDRFLELDLSKYDLVYYMDADQEVVGTIEGSEIIPVEGQLVAVTHPCSKHSKTELFETNPSSAAYCNPRLLGTYYHANFFGGHREDFLKLSRECAGSVAKDLSNRIIAKWDDESHLNRYLASHPPKVLPSTYGYPSYDTEDVPNKKIMHFAKDQDSMRAYRTAGNGGTRGVVLLAAGNRCYGDYAANFAASILQADPEAKITLFATDSAVQHLDKVQKGYFDKILAIPQDTLYVGGVPYYNRFKLFLPHISPYDETLYFDVDSLWVSKMGIGQLFDFMKVHKAQLGGQCEAVVPVTEDAVLFKGIKDLKPLQAFHPPLSFPGKKFYQLHGQCLYCTKTPTVIQVFDTAVRIFDAMLRNELTCTLYWVWHGQPMEELCITLATAMVAITIPDAVAGLAPVSVQSEGLKEIDPFSTKRFVISINGYSTHEEAGKVGGYCMGEKETSLYIDHYNKRIESLQESGYRVSKYSPKIVQL